MTKTKKQDPAGDEYQFRGEDLLSSLKDVTLGLENGDTATLSIEEELRTPQNPVDVEIAARRAVGRLAFWRYQEARTDAAVRDAERALREMESAAAVGVRDEKIQGGDAYVPKEIVYAEVDLRSDVRRARIGLDDLKTQRAIVRVVADALEHRTYLLRKLVGHRPDAT